MSLRHCSLVTYFAYGYPPESHGHFCAATGCLWRMLRRFPAALASAARSCDLCRPIRDRGKGLPLATGRRVRVRAEHRHAAGRCLAKKSSSRALQHPSIHSRIRFAVHLGRGTKCAMHLDVEGW